jgi:hypothetical protein
MTRPRTQEERAPGEAVPRSHVIMVLRLLALSAMMFSLFKIATSEYWIDSFGGVSAFTLACVSGLYLLSVNTLAKNLRTTDSVILSILYAASFVTSYEVIYHFTFPVYLNYLRPPFLGGQEIRYLVTNGVIILPIFLMSKHLKLKRTSLILLMAFVATWTIWILYGFPQYFANDYYYPIFLKTEDPYRLSLRLNFGSKVLLAAFFGSCLNPRPNGLTSMLTSTQEHGPPVS